MIYKKSKHKIKFTDQFCKFHWKRETMFNLLNLAHIHLKIKSQIIALFRKFTWYLFGMRVNLSHFVQLNGGTCIWVFDKHM